MILDATQDEVYFTQTIESTGTAKKQFNLAMPIHLSKKQTVGWDHISRRLLKINEVARPVGIEPTTSCLEAL
jgi:hypothetical protein